MFLTFLLQVFAAALNVREPNSDNAADTPLVARKRRFLLQAAYEGTYLAAKEGNNQEVRAQAIAFVLDINDFEQHLLNNINSHLVFFFVCICRSFT